MCFFSFQRPSSKSGGDVNYSTYPGRSATSFTQSSGLPLAAPDSSSFFASGGATLSRVHFLQQGPTPDESIKRQTLSARGLSDKEFTKHCRGFDSQIKVGYFPVTYIVLRCIIKKHNKNQSTTNYIFAF